jgi:glycosyltransferase involved in cell wall biosynthesis
LTVTYAGRLAPEKDLVQIRDAARELPSLRFRIAGEGPLREEVEGWASELPNLDYVGWISRDRVMDLLDQTDLLVLPSRFETFGTVALEAMVRRRLVLVSQNCGIIQWPRLASGLFQMEEGETLGQAITGLCVLAPEERAAVAGRGMREARAAAEETVDEWLEVLRSAVAQRRLS